MCTISFYPITDSYYFLSMNRDEARTRTSALPPHTSYSGKTLYIRPLDGEKGGTWIGVNQQGLSMCVMNWYGAQQPDGDSNYFISRGWIIPNLMDSVDLNDCDKQLHQLVNQKIRPFRLLAVQPDPIQVKEWYWDMNQLQTKALPAKQSIWTSSGWEPEHVHRVRKRVFENFWKAQDEVTFDKIKALHATQLPEPGPLAISMSHPKAMSVSNTIIEVAGEKAAMHYLDGFPAKSHDWHRLEMAISVSKIADEIAT